ncbi:MAG: hypothetical protein KF773_01005 [Deltaproteobacteria bacterium]|nr:hypothetical protein [Deltaproteobacteria bacterium]MCW5800767.1 hypothetical protein [Deltaproteobacteria bacterium]
MLSFVAAAVSAVASSGCPGGGAGLGDPCDNSGNCEGRYQCLRNVCVPLCKNGPECGDGYSCDADGICHEATGQPGDLCQSETDCAAGLTCRLDPKDPDRGVQLDARDRLVAHCTSQNQGRPVNTTCTKGDECRNGMCSLGRCVDLCVGERDCVTGTSCQGIPSIEHDGMFLAGCLQSKGALAWSIPLSAPTGPIAFPVPTGAQSALLAFSVDDPTQKVGAQLLTSPAPDDEVLYTKPCEPNFIPGNEMCTPDKANEQYYSNPVRHAPEFGQSVLLMPSSSSVPLQSGMYGARVSSYRANGTGGTAIPRVTAVVRIGPALVLDLNFHFLDLDSHPCQDQFGGARLDGTSAQAEAYFQSTYLDRLRSIFANGNIALGTITYRDILDHPDLDGLDVADAGALLELGTAATGINVFFVRSLSPIGLQAFGPNPGPAGLGGTRRSGIVIGLDTLCYRSWEQVARLTAHELARYMGLYHNVEHTRGPGGVPWRDAINDSDDSPTNLMYYSELGGGTDLSPGQREILMRSGVLR